MQVNILFALVSVGVGALLGGVVHAAVGRYSVFKESKGMAAALRAELESIIKLVHHRGFDKDLADRIQLLNDPSYQPTPEDIFKVVIAQNYFAVFDSLCPRIGLLGHLSELIVLCYIQSKSLTDQLRALQEIRDRALRGTIGLNREHLLERMLALHELLHIALANSRQLIEDLNTYTERRWLWLFS